MTTKESGGAYPRCLKNQHADRLPAPKGRPNGSPGHRPGMASIRAHDVRHAPRQGTMEGVETAGCYVHIPFCVRKCAYCDFNSYSGYTDGGVASYVAALEREIRNANRRDGEPIVADRTEVGCAAPNVDTIFFGGGTHYAHPPHADTPFLYSTRLAPPVAPDVAYTS